MIFKTKTDDFGRLKTGLNDGIKDAVTGIFNGNFFKRQNLLSDSDITAIKAYNAEIDKCTTSQTAFYRTMQNTSKEAQNVVAAANGNKVALDGLTKSSKAAELGMKALSMAGNMLLMWGISEAITIIYDLATASDRLQESASQLGNEFANTKSDIDDYKGKIEELYQTINDDTSSYEDTYNARQELLKIQDEMIDKFGDEADAVKLVTDAINGQTDSLDTLTQDKWQETVNAFNSDRDKKWTEKVADAFANIGHGNNFQRMLDEMEDTEVTFHIMPMYGDETYEEFSKKLKEDFGASLTQYERDDAFTLSGDLDDIYKQLLNIQNLAKDMGIDDTFLKDLGDQADEAKGKLEDYQEIYSQHVLYDKIFNSEDYEKSFDEINKAYEKYQDAFASGDEEAIEKAKQNYAEIVQGAIEGLDDQSVIDYFNNMYPDLQEIVGGWEFEVKFKAAIDDDKDDFENEVKDAVSQFNTVEDIKNYNPKVATEEQKDAYLQLKQYADDYGLTLDQLIAKLEQMGLLQSQSKSDLLNKLVPSKNGLTAGVSSTLSDAMAGVDADEATKWVDSLTEEEAKLANSKEFENTLEEQKKKLNGAALSADDYKTALQSVKDAQNQTSDETPISSFEDAWTSLKASTDDDLKGQTDDLLKLAEAGQLTGNALEELAGGQELMKNTGLSADELAKKINGLVTASTQLNSMSAQISKMSDLLADKKNGETASASDLAGFDATVRGLDSWEQFEKVMGDSKSSMKDCQEAANALATEWVNNSEFLDNLTEDNKGYYETQLKNMGVENAEQVVTAALAQKKNELAIQQEYETACKEVGITASADLATVTGTEIQALLDEGKISIDTASKLAELVVKKRLANGASLSTAGDIRNLAALAGAATTLGRLLTKLADIKQGFTNGMPSDVAAKQIESYEKQINDYVSGGSNTNVSDVQISPSGSSTYKAPSSKKSKSSKDSKSTIDWIDRKLSVLQTKIDLTQSKFDNLFNLKSPKNLKKNIDSVTKSLSSAQSKAESFKKKMSSVNLDSSTKKKVQNGTVKLSDYSKTDQKRIKQYQKYYSSYEKYATKVKSLQKELNTLNSSGGKINNLNTQIKQMKALESATSKAIKKYSSYASGVKLSKSLKNKVKNGDYTISDYDSKTQEQITKYQNYIDKIAELRKQLQELKGDIQDTKIEKYQLIVDDADAKRSKSEAWGNVESVNDSKKMNSHVEYQKQQVKQSYAYQIKIAKAEHDSVKVSQLRAERLKEIRELTYQEAENITTAYDNQLKLNDAKRQGIQSALSLAETRGDQIGSKYYSSQISLNNSDLSDRKDERSKLLGKLKTLEKYSEEWYKVYDLLQNVNGEISNLKNNTAELQRKQYNLKWDRFDELQNKLSDITTEASFLIDLLDSDNFFDDKGMITDDGVTAMGLSLENYDVYLAQAQKYKDAIAQLEKDYASNKISYDDYTSKMREYTQGEQNAIKSANELKKSVVSYVKQGLDAQNEALSEEIDKRKKLLEQEKTEKSFNDTTLEQNKKIARLKRQISILENDDSDSNRKTLRELKSQLQDAEKEQSDSFYDKSISDQEESLDTMLENSKKQAEEYLKDTDKVFADALVYVNAHADQVSTRLEKLAQDTGFDISNNITAAWKGSGDAVGTYADTMSKNVPKITGQIGLITSAWNAQCEAADKAAAASARASSNSYSKGSDYGLDDDTYTTYTTQEIKKYITDHLDKGSSTASYGALNKYLYSKTGKVLSKAEHVQLAKMLGVSVKDDLSGKNDRQNILDALKKKNIKFANGGVLGDLIKVSGEDGLFIGSTGESVLTKEQTQALMKFAPIVPQMSNLMDNMKNVVPVNNRSVSEPHIEINTTVEGIATDKIVKDFENVATRQAENVVKRINSATYAKGVRPR